MAYLSEQQHRLVSDAVAEAELTTSGEIVTVLADRSDGYSDVVLVYAAGMAFTAMSVFAALPRPFLDLWDALIGGWGHDWSTGELASMTIALGLVAFAASWVALSFDALRFALVPKPVKAARARNAAVRHFKVGAESRTHGRTGVLLYLSLDEHRAEIVADRAINEKVAPEAWGEAMAALIDAIRAGQAGDGLAEAIRQVGIILAAHFPRDDDDVNELPDRLIEL